MSAFETILYTVADGVGTITLNRPDSYNAANEQLTSELQQALADARDNDAVRCVVLTGAGKAFCSGQDLKDAPKSGDKRDLKDSLERRYNPIIRAMRSMPKPIICGINGVAAGAGLSLALAADVRIMSDTGQEVPFGETGELWINGPMVVPGYWDNPEATAQSFTAGYWHSGDLGCMDEEGFVKIFDRKKDMLNRGGFKIYSVEVENCLMGIPGVLEAAIVGKPCPVLGERVHAFIYAPNQSISQDIVTTHCKQALADYKVPETITWLETPLPRNANGKVMKRQLRLDF